MIPILKRKQRMSPQKHDTKLVNASQDEILDDKYMSELFDAAESRNVKAFRSALEAYVMNCFEHGDTDESK